MIFKIGDKTKKKKYLFILALIYSSLNAQTSYKYGDVSMDIDPNAVLELDSKVKGFLLPRVPLVNTLSISPMSGTLTPGMTVFNTESINDVTPGFYYWNLKWIRIADSAILESSSISGILPVIHGGTGTATSSGTGDVILSNSPTLTGNPNLPTGTIGVTQATGDSSSALATTAFVTSEIIAINNLADGKIYLGNSSNQATEVTLIGDVSVSNSGVTTISNGVIINTDVNASAAIEGTKIAPDFGNQNISTTGNTSIGGVLGVSGLATLNSVAVTTNATLGGNLNVTGTTTTAAISATDIIATGTLGILGATTLSATLGVTGIVTLAAQPIIQSLTASLPVFTDSNKGLVSNPITGTGNVVLSNSPTLTGIPSVPTPIAGTNTTQIATTAFVMSNSDRYYSVDSSEEISTRATSDEVVPGMSLISELGGTYAVSFNSQYEINPSDRTMQVNTDMVNGYNILMALTPTETIASAIATRTFTPGIYNVAAAGTVAAGVVITLNGSGTYVFRFGAALSMGANVSIVLQGGASASDVFWIAEGAIAIGADANINGFLISNSGAVDLAAGCDIVGKLLTINQGAISISGSNVTNTSTSNLVNWGLLSSFVIFCHGGVVSNAGASNIVGDIGTKDGNITNASFAPATIIGEFHTAQEGSALATFSIYQNGVIIANSRRTRYSTINTSDFSLQAIVTVAAGQAVDVRWNVDSGSITLKNRILTLINVR
jgi:hypothetical protein